MRALKMREPLTTAGQLVAYKQIGRGGARVAFIVGDEAQSADISPLKRRNCLFS